MDQNIIIQKWLDEAFGEKDKLPLMAIRNSEILVKAVKFFEENAETVIRQKMDSLFDHPLLSKTAAGEEGPVLGELRELLVKRITFDRLTAEKILRYNFKSIYVDKFAKPIVISSENADNAAKELIARAAYNTGAGIGAAEFGCEALAEVCWKSNLPLIAEAVTVEGELGTVKLNAAQLAVLIRRSVLLSSRMAGKTAEAKPAEVQTEVKVKPAVQEPMTVKPKAVEPGVKPVLPPEKPAVKPEVAKTKPVREEKTPEVETPAPFKRHLQEVKAAAGKQVTAEKTVESKPKPAAGGGGKLLKEKLLSPENLAFFCENLYENDEEKYRVFLDKLCSADSLKQALTETSNELYYLDIPESEVSAAKLIGVIRECF